LNLQLAIVNEARTRDRLGEAERLRPVQRRVEDLERRMGDLARADHEKSALLVRKEAELIDRDRELRSATAQIHVRNVQVAEILASTSWKVSRPVRWAGVAVRRTRKLAAAARVLVSEPSRIQENVSAVWRAWRTAG